MKRSKYDLTDMFQETHRDNEDTFSFDWVVAGTMIGTALICTIIYIIAF